METNPIDIKLPVSSKYLGVEYPDRIWDDKGMFVCMAATEHIAVIKNALNTHPQLLEALVNVTEKLKRITGIEDGEAIKAIVLATGSEVAE